MTPLTRAWILLLALSAASTGIAAMVSAGRLGDETVVLAGGAILCLAWAKARLILARYLGLARAPFWRRGFELSLAFFVLGLLGLYLMAGR